MPLYIKRTLSPQAISGQAIDRHLLGLKMVAIEEKLALPAIFTDKAYGKALHYKLSTSQVWARLENKEMQLFTGKDMGLIEKTWHYYSVVVGGIVMKHNILLTTTFHFL